MRSQTGDESTLTVIDLQINHYLIKALFSPVVHNFSTFKIISNTSLVEKILFLLEGFSQLSPHFCIRIERTSKHSISMRSKLVEIRLYRIGRVRRVLQQFPSMPLNGFFGHTWDMRMGAVVQQKNPHATD